MEPMNLGTPSNSGPSSPTTTPTGSPYLPSFLLGDSTSPLPGSTSPKGKRGGNQVESQSYSSFKYFSGQNNNNQHHPANTEHLISGEKVSGPPIRGLFDTVSSPAPVESSKHQSESNAYISSVARQFNDVISPSLSSEASESTWVTIFGYPPAAACFILSHFASCGHILSRKVPASGNWMHVQFSSRLEAKRALACNGKIFSGSVMVGVLPCRDQSILSDKTLERSLAETSALSVGPSSPRGGIYPDLHRSVDVSVYESPYASPRLANARPLVTRHDSEIYSSGITPQKTSGIVSKAMELLGW